MGIAHVQTVGRLGVRCFPLAIEVDVSTGLPSLTVVGLPDTVIQESKERIRAAIKNSGLEFPLARITVNLAPSDLKKEGIGFDVPIALGILAASGQVPPVSPTDSFFGELGLEGQFKPTRGVLSFVLHSEAARGFLPQANIREAALAPQADHFYGIGTLKEMVRVLRGEQVPHSAPTDFHSATVPIYDADFADIYGQEGAKRLLEIAAAGQHNAFLRGAPGSGKTLLARAFPSILPPLSREECLEATQIHSIAGLLTGESPIVTQRPFRAPHHSATVAAILGGGIPPRPGEITLAHHGVLFLDECAEFPRPLLEALRQPLEDRLITVSRAGYSVPFPANILLLAAMNPCPCGYKDDPYHDCVCTLSQISHYEKKMSGPILDRIDLHMTVPAISAATLSAQAGEPSDDIRKRVIRAREIQQERYKDTTMTVNAQLGSRDIAAFCTLEPEGLDLLHAGMERLRLTVRGYHKIIKVARTIADLAGSPSVTAVHVGEALQYRSLV